MSWKHPCSFEKRLCFILGCFSYFYCDLLGPKTLISFCATFACSHLSVNIIIVLCRQCQVHYSEECILEVFINSWMFSYSSPATPPLSFVCVFQFVWNSVQVTKIIWMEQRSFHLFPGEGKQWVYKGQRSFVPRKRQASGVQITKIISFVLKEKASNRYTSNKDHFICSQEKASNSWTSDKDHFICS